MAVVEVSILPLGTGTPSMSRYVAGVLKVLKWIREMHEVPFKEGVKRVVTTIEIDDRRDKELTIEGKVNSVRDIIKKV